MFTKLPYSVVCLSCELAEAEAEVRRKVGTLGLMERRRALKPEMRARNVKMAGVRIRSLKATHDRPWRKAKLAIGQGRQTAWRLFEIILTRSKQGAT
jgi:hypothetical protein